MKPFKNKQNELEAALRSGANFDNRASYWVPHPVNIEGNTPLLLAAKQAARFYDENDVLNCITWFLTYTNTDALLGSVNLQQTLLSLLCSFGYAKCVEYLLARILKYVLLHQLNDSDAVSATIEVYLTTADKYKNTALSYALKAGSTSCFYQVQELLYLYRQDTEESGGLTPFEASRLLRVAMKKANYPVVTWLANHGAKFSQGDESFITKNKPIIQKPVPSSRTNDDADIARPNASQRPHRLRWYVNTENTDEATSAWVSFMTTNAEDDVTITTLEELQQVIQAEIGKVGKVKMQGYQNSATLSYVLMDYWQVELERLLSLITLGTLSPSLVSSYNTKKQLLQGVPKHSVAYELLIREKHSLLQIIEDVEQQGQYAVLDLENKQVLMTAGIKHHVDEY